MLTGIIKATRAHYAALQHKPAADRVAIDYSVGHPINGNIVCGTIWVRAWNNVYHPGKRQAELTKLINRLSAMYPEARETRAQYRPIDKEVSRQKLIEKGRAAMALDIYGKNKNG